TLPSRDGVVLRTYQPRDGFHTPRFRETLARIAELLSELRRTLRYFEGYEQSRHPDFHTLMLMLSTRAPSQLGLFVESMDQIDILRNKMLAEVNILLKFAGKDPFSAIPLSSSILAASDHPENRSIAFDLGLRPS